jgi:hypothetical protein
MAGDNQSSSATVSAEDFQEVHEQIRQLMQGMQALQLSLQQQQRSEPLPNDNDHIEDDDPSALEAEAARLQADAVHCAVVGGGSGGGGRGRGDGRELDTGFGNLGGVNRRPQFFCCARRVPFRGARDFNVDDHYDYSDEQGAGPYGHRGGYDAHGGANFGHFGNYGDNQFGEHGGYRDRRHRNHEHRQDENGLGKVKASIPLFNGMENAYAYFEWETKVDQIFDLYNYLAAKKAKLVAIEFKGYAITWWNQIRADYQRFGDHHITWKEMKREL